MQGLFVTGTGTGVGKSIVAAALCAALVDERRPVIASKPMLSGLEEPPDAPWPYDHDLLALVTDDPADDIAPHRFGPAVSPHLAARLADVELTVDDLVAGVRARVAAAAERAGAEPSVVVEGAGGLLVPINDHGATMADLASGLDLPLLVVAHPGLGTINHVHLTLEAARARGLTVAAVVLTPWGTHPTLIEQDNRALLEKTAGVPVLALPVVEAPKAPLLAAAAESAGLDRLL